MTNTNLLKAKIKEKGLIQSTAASKIGISAQSLNAKINGKKDFSSTEILLLHNLLGIKKEDIGSIFFI